MLNTSSDLCRVESAVARHFNVRPEAVKYEPASEYVTSLYGHPCNTAVLMIEGVIYDVWMSLDADRVLLSRPADDDMEGMPLHTAIRKADELHSFRLSKYRGLWCVQYVKVGKKQDLSCVLDTFDKIFISYADASAVYHELLAVILLEAGLLHTISMEVRQ